MPVLTLDLGGKFELEVQLIQEMKKLSILDNHQNLGSIAGESSIKSDSLDISQEIGSFDPEGGLEQNKRSTYKNRYSSLVCEDVFSV